MEITQQELEKLIGESDAQHALNSGKDLVALPRVGDKIKAFHNPAPTVREVIWEANLNAVEIIVD